ncbi:MAG: DUF932 domain-containing protein [Candidimonas sp.]
MTAAVETMAYAGATPWHGLGKPVSDNLTPTEMTVAAGIDWSIAVRDFPVVEGLTNDTNLRLLVRENADGTANLFDTVSNRYKPIQNVDAMQLFADVVATGDMTMETAGSLKDGHIVWGLAKTAEGFDLGGDPVEGYLLMYLPHKPGACLQARYTPTRVVCRNTLSIALSETSISGVVKHRHDRLLTDAVMESMKEQLGVRKSLMSDLSDQAKHLAGVSLNEADMIRYLAQVFDPSVIADLDEHDMFPTKIEFAKSTNVKSDFTRIIDGKELNLLNGKSAFVRACRELESQPGWELPSSKWTAWGAFNTVTWGLDHLMGRTDASRMEASIGRNQLIKDRALDLALKLTNSPTTVFAGADLDATEDAEGGETEAVEVETTETEAVEEVA